MFTKWVEIGAIASVDAAMVRRCFHKNIVYRYGVPGMVRTDGGAEFKGEFCSYLRGSRCEVACDLVAKPTCQWLS